MTVTTFANGTISQRIKMIEDALEKVLDRGPEMAVEPYAPGEDMHVYVLANDFGHGDRISHSLYTIARELEVLLP